MAQLSKEEKKALMKKWEHHKPMQYDFTPKQKSGCWNKEKNVKG